MINNLLNKSSIKNLLSKSCFSNYGSRGSLSGIVRNYLFKSGNFNFTDNLWEDISFSENHASLVGGYCVEFMDDVTLTLKTPLIGSTITKVNDSAALTTGLVVDGAGDVTIDFSELVVVDNKIWNVFLSTGEEFRFTTGTSPYIFAADNRGALSGTETTEWQWSTTDNAHLNLRYGCSIMPYGHTTGLESWDENTIRVYESDAFEIYWEGIRLDTGSYLFNFSLRREDTGAIKSYVCRIIGDNLTFTTRTDKVSPLWTNPGDIDFTEWVKIKLEYNGGGLDTAANFTITVNGNEQIATAGALATSDNTRNYWAGNNSYSAKVLVRNHYIRVNDILYPCFVDGELHYFIEDRPAYYGYIPVFSLVDAVGETPTHPAYIDSYNGCETKIKMPVDGVLFANDVNGILYTDALTPNELDLTQFYDNFGGKIHLDNSNRRKLHNFIITLNITDLREYVNGMHDRTNLVSIRTDRHANMLGQVIEEQGVRADTHTTRLMYFDDPAYSEYYLLQIADGRLSIFMHDCSPSFWLYKDYSEGEAAWTISTAEEKTDFITTQDMGTIGAKPTANASAKETIEDIHTFFEYPYPGGIPPSDDDDNEDWWEWVIDAYIAEVAKIGGTISGYTQLGSYPVGINELHPEVIELLLDKIYSKTYFDIPNEIIEDDLEGDVSIFSASVNGSIVVDGADKCQKLAGNAAQAWGLFDIGRNRKGAATYSKIEFDVKYTAGDRLFTSLHPHYYYATGTLLNGSDITADIDTWYKVVFQWIGHYYDIRVYDMDGDTVFIKRSTFKQIYQRGGRMAIKCEDGDTLIKNIRYFYSYDRNLAYFYYSLGAKWDDLDAHTTETAAEWLEIMKTNTLIALRAGTVPFGFSHYVQDPDDKAADGTDDGILDRSYWGLTEWVKWCKAQGFEFVNVNTMPYSVTNRTNQMPALLPPNNMTVDAGEIEGSVDGTDVYKLAAAATSTTKIYFKNEGTKYLRFWAKGTFYINMKASRSLVPGTTLNANKFTLEDYTFVEIPIIIDESYEITDWTISITAVTDSFFNRIVMDDI